MPLFFCTFSSLRALRYRWTGQVWRSGEEDVQISNLNIIQINITQIFAFFVICPSLLRSKVCSTLCQWSGAEIRGGQGWPWPPQSLQVTEKSGYPKHNTHFLQNDLSSVVVPTINNCFFLFLINQGLSKYKGMLYSTVQKSWAMPSFFNLKIENGNCVQWNICTLKRANIHGNIVFKAKTEF